MKAIACRIADAHRSMSWCVSSACVIGCPSSSPRQFYNFGNHAVNVPNTLLSLVVAVLPVMVVLSMTTVPPASRSSPPPIPVPESAVAPALPGWAMPAAPFGLPPAPAPATPAAPPAPPGPATAWLAVMMFVALDCLEPFFAPSLG